tara:strand:+ start:1241 stop:1558 length:318 start_codon:yes stop_codon:yes gene_type:complete
MARTKGAQNKMTRDIKSAVEQAFKTINGKNNAGLIQLAKDEPKVFYSLVARCIPAAVAVSVTHQFDLGNAMIEAHENQQRLNAMQTIEQIPETPTTHKPLITKED